MNGRATVVARERTPRLGAVAVEMLESLYQHRLLSTGQVHALHTPTASVRFTQQQLARLQNAGLAASVHAVGALKLWFLSERGADAAETIGSRAETRRKVIAPEQAAGPLQQHTLAVNDVGVAFVEAARDRGDECGPFAWRHEIAHALPPAPGRHTPEQLIADAILAYQLGEPDGGTSFYYRFIELDRATMPTDELAAKLARYARLYHHSLPPADALDLPAPLWRHAYPVFPAVMLVLANASRKRLERRREMTLALCAQNRSLKDTPEVQIGVCLLQDLAARGPFAAIFHTLANPEIPADWLGSPAGKQPKSGSDG